MKLSPRPRTRPPTAPPIPTWPGRATETTRRSPASSSRCAASCTRTATACSARPTTPTMPCRTRCYERGGDSRASRVAARCGRGCTPWPPAPASTSSPPAASGRCPSISARPATARWSVTLRSPTSPGWAPTPRPVSPADSQVRTLATSSAKPSSWPSSPPCSTCRATSGPRSCSSRSSTSPPPRSPRR